METKDILNIINEELKRIDIQICSYEEGIKEEYGTKQCYKSMIELANARKNGIQHIKTNILEHLEDEKWWDA